MSSVGGLFLQVKLKTDGLQAQFESIARSANAITGNLQRQMNTLTRQSSTLAANMRQISTSSRNLGTSAGTTPAQARQVAQATQQQAKAVKQIASLSEPISIANRGWGLNFNSLQAKSWTQQVQSGAKATISAQQAQDRQAKAAQRTTQAVAGGTRQQQRTLALLLGQNQAIGKQQNLARQTASVLSSGQQELFVGLGAARSGNYFYGLAALARYGKNVLAAMGGMSVATAGAAAGVAAVGIAAVGTAAAVGYLTVKIGELGTSAAINLQLVRAQFTGLLESATAANEELNFIFELAKVSTVPTDALIGLDKALITSGLTATQTRQDVVGALSTIGTAAQLTGDQVGGLVYVLGQVASQGRAYRLDLRQFANNGVASARLLESIAAATGKSVAEITAQISNGGIAAEDVFAGLVALAEEMAPAAEKAAGSVVGLVQNIQEQVNTGFGVAFEKAGVADTIGKFLKQIQDALPGLLQAIEPTARAFNNLFSAIGEALGQTTGGFEGGNFIETLFGSIIPGVVNTAASAVRAFGRVMQAIGPLLLEVFRSIGASVSALIDVVRELLPVFAPFGQYIAGSFIAGMTALAITLRAVAAVFITVAYAAKAANLAMQGDFAGAQAALDEGAAKLKEQWDGIGAALAAAAVSGTALANIDFSNLDGSGWNDGTPEPFGGGGDFGNAPPVDAAPVEEASQEMQDAIDSLRQSMKRFLGARSEMEASLLGTGKDFTTSADQIIAAAKGIRDSIRAAFPAGETRAGLIETLKTQTRELAKLANQRDRIATKLEEAQKRYEALLAEQNQFSNSIVSGFTSFVNSLQLEEKEVTTFTTNAGDGFAGWVSETTTQTQSFQDALAERVKALKEFVANIRNLQARGLDAGLVKQLIEAGPQAAGEVAAQLAGASNGTIREINGYQAELNSIARSFADEQASIYYDAGVNAAKGQVDGLTSKLDRIKAKARKIVEDLRATLQNAIDPATTAGEQTAAGYAAGLESQRDKVVNTAKDIARDTRDAFRRAIPGPNDPETRRRINAYRASLAEGLRVTTTTAPLVPGAVVPPATGTVLNPDQIDAAASPVLVQVRIGERDITDIVDTKLKQINREDALAVRRGYRTVR